MESIRTCEVENYSKNNLSVSNKYIQIPFHVSLAIYTLMKYKDELNNKTIEFMANKTIDRNLREEFLGSQ